MRAALEGIRVVDLSRLAPGPFCSMLLGDFGADIVLVEPPGGSTRGGEAAEWELALDDSRYVYDGLRRNKRSIVLDLKRGEDQAVFRALVRTADVVLEGFRPGVAERLGASYEQCRALNPRVVHCSVSGWGQQSPRASAPGHDINYIAEAGVLAAAGGAGERPAIPLNLLADFAGGGLYAAFAVAVALLHRERTGEGQAVDLAMVDGALSLLTQAASLYFGLGIEPVPGRFFLSGGLPYYDVYRCADGEFVAVGALEPWFFAALCRATGKPELASAHARPEQFDAVAAHLRSWFGSRSREAALAEVGDAGACVSPVLSLPEAIESARERGMVVTAGGAPQLAAAPRLSLTPASVRLGSPRPGEHGDEIRAELASAGAFA